MAGHMRLGRLIVLFDDNGISIDGSTDLAVSDDTTARFTAYGWQVLAVDGHDMKAVSEAIAEARAEEDRPTLIRCRTVIGYGAPTKAGTSGIHGAPLGGEEIAGTRSALGWSHEPFDIPQSIIDSWRAVGARGRAAREAWQARHDAADSAAFDAALAGDFDAAIDDAVQGWKSALAADPQKIATRVASQKALDAIVPACPTLIGGSADLTGSNNTQAGGQDIFSGANPAGTYVHYGVREHGMAAAMNGIALHGGTIPYGGTFLVFADYCRPSIRLSALMKQRVIYVMTHDSIGLGEDGPTHQPVEHLAALRAIPNLLVFRPGDAVETAEAWQCALAAHDRPSVLALSRQGLEQFRLGDLTANRTAEGAYVVAGGDQDSHQDRQVTILATGSEVGVALAARNHLAADGIEASVVSVPSMELFRQRDAAEREAVLGTCPRIVVEAAIRQPWDWVLRDGDDFIGMDGFGASGPAGALFAHFGITAEAVAARARAMLD